MKRFKSSNTVKEGGEGKGGREVRGEGKGGGRGGGEGEGGGREGGGGGGGKGRMLISFQVR